MDDRESRVGWWVSGGAHVALILWAILGGVFFRPQPSVPLRSTEVSTMSGAEFEALAAASRGAGPVTPDATAVASIADPADDADDAAAPAQSPAPDAADAAQELARPDPSEAPPDLSEFDTPEPVDVATDLPDTSANQTDGNDAAPPPAVTDAPVPEAQPARPQQPVTDQPAVPVAPRSELALDQSAQPRSRPDGLVEAYRARIAAAEAARQAAADAAQAATEAAEAAERRAAAEQERITAEREAAAEAARQAEAEADAAEAARAAEAEAEAAERRAQQQRREAAEREERAAEERRAAEAREAEERRQAAERAEAEAEAERQAEADRQAEQRRAAEAREAEERAEEERRAAAEREAEQREAAAREAEERAEAERQAAAQREAEEREAAAREAAARETAAREAAEQAEAAAAERALEERLRAANEAAAGGADGSDPATTGQADAGNAWQIEGGSGASASQDPLAAALSGAMGNSDAAPQPDPSVAPMQLLPSARDLPDRGAQIDAPPMGPPLSLAERDGFRMAIRDCWNVGALSVEASRMTVSVGFAMAPDGRPQAASLRIADYRGGSETAAQQAFDVARRAILICGRAGYPLPADKYGRWRDVVVDFRPDGIAFE